MVKKILSIVLWVITGAALIVLFVYGRKHYLETPLKGIDFQLERPYQRGFVNTDSVLSYVEAATGIRRQAEIASVDVIKISRWLESNPWVEQSQAYIGLNDTLVIRATEYSPILRVFNGDRRSIYVTAEGALLPYSPYYTPRTIIASGDFNFPWPLKSACLGDTLYSHSGIAEALEIALAVEKDDFLASNIGQIHKNGNDYELSVNTLSAKVVLGDTRMLDNKLARLRKLLEKYSGTEELKAYKTLNLRYKNQIVCTK